MRLQVFRDLWDGPFHPLVVRTSDGREYVVREPFSLLVAPHEVWLLDERRRLVRLDPLHVVAVSPLQQSGTTTS
jgi:hypothetical protein